jgi:hypothetical protein
MSKIFYVPEDSKNNMNYGRVEHEGKEYILTSEAVFTGRHMPYNRDFNDVEEGQEYDFEMSANAKDNNGKEYYVYWIFTDIRGQEKETEDYDYDNIKSVLEA